MSATETSFLAIFCSIVPKIHFTHHSHLFLSLLSKLRSFSQKRTLVKNKSCNEVIQGSKSSLKRANYLSSTVFLLTKKNLFLEIYFELMSCEIFLFYKKQSRLPSLDQRRSQQTMTQLLHS